MRFDDPVLGPLRSSCPWKKSTEKTPISEHAVFTWFHEQENSSYWKWATGRYWWYNDLFSSLNKGTGDLSWFLRILPPWLCLVGRALRNLRLDLNRFNFWPSDLCMYCRILYQIFFNSQILIKFFFPLKKKKNKGNIDHLLNMVLGYRAWGAQEGWGRKKVIFPHGSQPWGWTHTLLLLRKKKRQGVDTWDRLFDLWGHEAFASPNSWRLE